MMAIMNKHEASERTRISIARTGRANHCLVFVYDLALDQASGAGAHEHGPLVDFRLGVDCLLRKPSQEDH
jgi:hypothetical protein